MSKQTQLFEISLRSYTRLSTSNNQRLQCVTT